MIRFVHATVLAGLAALFTLSALPASSDDKQYDGQGSLREVIRGIENTTFVWFDEINDRAMLQSLAVEFTSNEREILSVYPILGGFAVQMKTNKARERLNELKKSETFPKSAYIESDVLVYGFNSGCQAPQNLPSSQETPVGIKRVKGGKAVENSKVWIVDSGVGADFDGSELVVDRTSSRECTLSGCVPNSAAQDLLGHGTMIAGIIAAIDDDDGLVGVAPGATVIPVRIFDSTNFQDLRVIYHAIAYLLDPDPTIGAESGDVVNISWGFNWNPHPASEHRRIEKALRKLADQGVKIAIAAGNNDITPPLGGGGYVQAVSPARIGGYTGGVIFTVSAAESTNSNGKWMDVFWPDSVFGNGEQNIATKMQIGPPNFAEPGVNIKSLWPASTGTAITGSNTCTGTSFAVAHMSGILLHGMPLVAGQVKYDPSALIPGGISSSTGAQCWIEPLPGDPPRPEDCYEEWRQDPIGVVP